MRASVFSFGRQQSLLNFFGSFYKMMHASRHAARQLPGLAAPHRPALTALLSTLAETPAAARRGAESRAKKAPIQREKSDVDGVTLDSKLIDR